MRPSLLRLEPGLKRRVAKNVRHRAGAVRGAISHAFEFGRAPRRVTGERWETSPQEAFFPWSFRVDPTHREVRTRHTCPAHSARNARTCRRDFCARDIVVRALDRHVSSLASRPSRDGT